MKTEREFLHDIATPMAVAMGMLELSIESLKAQPGADPKTISKLEKAYKAVVTMAELLQARRAELPPKVAA